MFQYVHQPVCVWDVFGRNIACGRWVSFRKGGCGSHYTTHRVKSVGSISERQRLKGPMRATWRLRSALDEEIGPSDLDLLRRRTLRCQGMARCEASLWIFRATCRKSQTPKHQTVSRGCARPAKVGHKFDQSPASCVVSVLPLMPVFFTVDSRWSAMKQTSLQTQDCSDVVFLG